MATSQYTYHPFHTIGAASVFLWDAAALAGAGGWAPLGRVADAAVLSTTEQAGKSLVVKGLTQPVARRNRAKRYSLSFRMLEDANPLALDLLFGDGAAVSRSAAADASTKETLRLYGADYAELAHPYGILNGGLPPVTDLSASTGGTGGSIPTGSYYYWVIPYVISGGATLLGKPARTDQRSVTLGQVVTLRFTEPQGYIPDGYYVAYTLTSTLTNPLLLVTPSPHETEVVIATHQGATPLPLSYDAGQVVVRSYNAQTLYVEGTDYQLDALRGLVKRLPGGGIGDGECVVASYSYRRPASVATPIGDPVELERYRKVKLLQLAPEEYQEGGDMSPAAWRETGLEFTFHRVNVAIGDMRLPFGEDDFSEGASVSWDCLYDPAEACVGSVRSTYGALAEY